MLPFPVSPSIIWVEGSLPPLVKVIVASSTLMVITNQRHLLLSSCQEALDIAAVALMVPMVVTSLALVVIAIGSDQVLVVEFEASKSTFSHSVEHKPVEWAHRFPAPKRSKLEKNSIRKHWCSVFPYDSWNGESCMKTTCRAVASDVSQPHHRREHTFSLGKRLSSSRLNRSYW